MAVLSTKTGSRRLALAAPLLAVGLALAACGTGQTAATSHEVSVVDGTSGSSGALSIVNAAISAPGGPSGYRKGGDVTLRLTMTNSGTTDDSLVSVTSTDALSSVLAPDGTASSAAAPADSTATSSAPPATVPIPVPRGESVPVGYSFSTATITLTGISFALSPSQLLPATFNFSSGKTITLTLPVATIDGQTTAPTLGTSPSSSE